MNKEQVTITRVFRGKKQTKFGEKDNTAIKTTQHGDKWLSTFKPQGTESWKEGDSVEIYVEKKGEFLNFSLQPASGAVNPNFAMEVNARLIALENKVFGSIKQDEPEPDVPNQDSW